MIWIVAAGYVIKKYWLDIVEIIGWFTIVFGCMRLFDEYFIKYWQKKTRTTGLILAAGDSKRWSASIKKVAELSEPFYQSISYENVNKSLVKLDPPETVLTSPPNNVSLHKTLAVLDNCNLIERAFIKYQQCGIRDLRIVISNETDNQARKEIQEYVTRWNSTHRDQDEQIRPEYASPRLEVTYSAFAGLHVIDHAGDTIVSYSDIVYHQQLLEELINKKGADIVVVVDTDWTNNYPRKRRAWHDELFAELAFWEGENKKIKIIGEIVRRYNGENIEEWSITNNDRFANFRFSSFRVDALL